MFTEFIGRMAPMAVLVASAVFVLAASHDSRQLACLHWLASSAVSAAAALLGAFGDRRDFSGCDRRLFAFFDEEPEVADRPGAQPIKVSRGQVIFDHVSFGYPPKGDVLEPRIILHDVNLVVEAGTTVALVGGPARARLPSPR